MEDSKELKLIAVGDKGVGKTALLVSYATNSVPDNIPEIAETTSKQVSVDGQNVSLGLWDIASSSCLAPMRGATYPMTNVFLVCFSLADPASLDHVKAWAKEVKKKCKKTPLVLVGLKSDLTRAVTTAQAERKAKDIKAVKYLECSVNKQEGVAQVFEAAARAALSPGKK